MARAMKKFSAGGAQGRYDRRMADIEKDYKKAMARKTGRAAEVAEAKRQQRIADAKDDLAKRTGADRSATRAAERAAEGNLTKTRKYGAAQSVTKDTAGPTGKVTDTLGALTAPKSGLATATKKPAAKTPVKAADKPKPSAADTARNKFFQDSLAKSDFKKTALGASNLPGDQGFSSKSKVLGASKGTKTETPKAGNKGTSRLATAADPTDTSSAASRARLGALASYLNPFSYIENRARRQDPSETNKAKGGKIMKYAKGGSTPPQPTPAERAAGAKFRESIKNIKPTPAQGKILDKTGKKMAKGGKVKKMALGGSFGGGSAPAPITVGPQQSAPMPRRMSAPTGAPAMQSAPMPSNMARQTPPATKNNTNMGASPQERALMRVVDRQRASAPPPRAQARNARTGPVGRAEGGKVKATEGGKAATKFGKALVKKSADTKGRAMVKKAGGGKCYASGGSVSSASKRADGCAVKGKTKGKMLARGGAAKMRGRDSYGGAMFKKGGSC
jgi:hypothetical protein